MKYFTRELLDRLNSQDEVTSEAAFEEWEHRHDEYLSHLKSIEEKLPERTLEFVNNFNLHDARFFRFGEKNTSEVMLILTPDSKSPPGVVLVRYGLTEKPAWTFDEQRHEADPSKDACWLYDEIDLNSKGEATHSILFSKGLELRLTFSAIEATFLPVFVNPAISTKELVTC